MKILLDWWNSEVFGELDQANRPHTPFGDEDWHVESDSDEDGPGMMTSCLVLSLSTSNLMWSCSRIMFNRFARVIT